MILDLLTRETTETNILVAKVSLSGATHLCQDSNYTRLYYEDGNETSTILRKDIRDINFFAWY